VTRKVTYGQAFNEAVRQEMAADDTVFCAGEDIGAFGGVFHTYAGLQAEFGERRVVDTPISEQAIIGLGVGAAATGLRPIVDIMFMDFICAPENAADLVGGVNVAAKDAQVMRAMLDMSTTAQIKDSLVLGREVLGRLDRVGDLHKREVEQAGFAVLKAPDIPSILIETAFISNPSDERRLRDAAHQQRLAEAIHAGVRSYFYEKPPPGTKLAAIVAARQGGSVAPQTLAER